MTHEIYLRFYEELNEFLIPEHRKRLFAYPLKAEMTVRDVLESLRVPLSQVDLVLLNGVAVDFSRHLSAGETLSVFPVFERLDITPVQRLRDVPLRQTQFLAAPGFGRLVRYLRALGFDTQVDRAAPGSDTSAENQSHRVALISEEELRRRPGLTRVHVVREQRAREQVRAILAALDLYRSVRPGTRCLGCNSLLAGSECPACGTPASALRASRLRLMARLICS